MNHQHMYHFHFGGFVGKRCFQPHSIECACVCVCHTHRHRNRKPLMMPDADDDFHDAILFGAQKLENRT